jgi:hypothetical protein
MAGAWPATRRYGSSGSGAGELAALPHAELAARLVEAYRVIGELTAQVGRLSVRWKSLSAGAAGFFHVVAAPVVGRSV